MSDLNFYWRMGDYVQGKRVQILNRLFLVQHA